jgi:chromosome partitioning protein
MLENPRGPFILSVRKQRRDPIMAAKIVTIAQQKGGAGKTTIAIQLAVTWAARGHRVAMLDVDPQGSVSAWFSMRATPPTRLVATDVPGWKLSGEIDRRRDDADILVIDTPPHAETDARVAIRAASLVLVPLQPSPMDLWATRPTLDLVRREKGRALMVLNRLPSRGRLADTIRQMIADENLPMAQATLGNRSAFAASMLEGKGVVETQPKGTAATEIRALAAEIGTLLALGTSTAA